MGDLVSYEIYYEENPINKMHVTVSPPENTFTIKDLSEGTTYKFEVSAKSDNGEGIRSLPIEGATQRFSKYSSYSFKRYCEFIVT